MPLIYLRSVWTPLALLGVKVYKDEKKHYYMRTWSKQLRRVI